MNKSKIKSIAMMTVVCLVALLAVGVIANAFNGGSPKVVVEGDYIEAQSTDVVESFGAVSSPDIYSDVRVHGALTSGARVLSLATSTGTTVLEASQLRENSLLEIMVNTGTTATLTLPATTTLLGLLDEGASRKWMIHNATSSTMALTIAAGTGIDLIGVTANDDVIDATEYSELECIRQSGLDWTCRISELVHVD